MRYLILAMFLVLVSCKKKDTDAPTPAPCPDDQVLAGDGNCYTPDPTDDTDGDLFCGNGLLDKGEDCDDGNADADDGCEECTAMAGWDCSGEPSKCDEICGDGMVVGKEGCDDDETVDFDGCSATCSVEPDYVCTGEPSVCTADCDSVSIYAGLGLDSTSSIAMPHTFQYSGKVGIDAGEAMCQAIGAHQVCTYEQLNAAYARGELSTSNTPNHADKLYDDIGTGTSDGRTVWLRRLVPANDAGGTLRDPGPGGRCNDWANGENHSTDGEFAAVDSSGVLTFEIDDDTVYTAEPAHGHQSSSPLTGCGGKARALPCCFRTCPQPPPANINNNGCDGVTPTDMTGQSTIDLDLLTLTAPFCIVVDTNTTFSHNSAPGMALFGGLYDPSRDEKHYHSNRHGGVSGPSPIVPGCDTWTGAACLSTWTLDTAGTYPFFADTDPANVRGAIFVQ